MQDGENAVSFSSIESSIDKIVQDNIHGKTHNKMNNLEEKSLESRKSQIKYLVYEDLTNEMARSIIKVFETPHLLMKIFVVVILVLVTGLSSYLAIESVLSYFDYEVSTMFRTVYETPTLFPKVTICNINPFTTENSYKFLKEINKVYFPDADFFNQTQMSSLSYSAKRSLLWRIYLLATSKMNDAFYTIDDKKKLGHSIEDIILACKFNNQVCSAQDFEWKFDRLYGNCLVFNAGRSKRTSTISGSWYGLKLSFYVNYYMGLKPFNSLFGYGAHVRSGNG